MEGPEGSTIWMAAHNLLLVDPEFARDQFDRAKANLAIDMLGFTLAREWPPGEKLRADVDSGPIVPLLDAGPASSGLMLVAASAFDDRRSVRGLVRSLELATSPVRHEGSLHYASAGPMGDAVILYGLTYGPVWERGRAVVIDPAATATDRAQLQGPAGSRGGDEE
jgi:hypothetical protein